MLCAYSEASARLRMYIQVHSDTHECTQIPFACSKMVSTHAYALMIPTQAYTEFAHLNTSTQAAADVRHQEGAHLLRSIEQSRFHLNGAEDNLDHVLQVNETLKEQREDALRRATNLNKRVVESKMDVDALRERRDRLAALEMANTRTKLKLCVR